MQLNIKFGIDRFVGLWESEDGYRLVIANISDTSAVVSFYDPSGEPVLMPYFNDKPTIKMPASYPQFNLSLSLMTLDENYEIFK